MRDDNERSENGPDKEEQVSETPQLPDDLKSFARRLGSFSAISTRLDRDALMFAAGQASKDTLVTPTERHLNRRVRVWQSATVAMSVVASCLGIIIMWQSSAPPNVIIVEREKPALRSTTMPQSDNANLKQTVIPDGSANPVSESANDSRQLADAWDVRRRFVDEANSSDRMAVAGPVVPDVAEIPTTLTANPPLTPISAMGERTSETIHRLLERQL
jgi:hypothetical protein